ASDVLRHVPSCCTRIFFSFDDPASTAIYTLSLHDALPICARGGEVEARAVLFRERDGAAVIVARELGLAQVVEADRQVEGEVGRSEEHTSELQSLTNLVCRLLLEKKKASENDARSTLETIV